MKLGLRFKIFQHAYIRRRHWRCHAHMHLARRHDVDVVVQGPDVPWAPPSIPWAAFASAGFKSLVFNCMLASMPCMARIYTTYARKFRIDIAIDIDVPALLTLHAYIMHDRMPGAFPATHHVVSPIAIFTCMCGRLSLPCSVSHLLRSTITESAADSPTALTLYVSSSAGQCPQLLKNSYI